jgi:Ricin-type beta-trefoil lectin domain
MKLSGITMIFAIFLMVFSVAAAQQEFLRGGSDNENPYLLDHQVSSSHRILPQGDGFTGCIEVYKGRTSRGTKIMLGDCSNYKYGFDDKEAGTGSNNETIVQFHSRLNEKMCMQATTPYREGSRIRLYPCNKKKRNQLYVWTGDIMPADDMSYCVIYNGQHADFGDSLLLKKCDKTEGYNWSEDS